MTAVAQGIPSAQPPRAYRFPSFERVRLDNGMTLITCNVPGRPMGAAHLLIEAASAYEDDAIGGVAALGGHALTEGTESYSGAEFNDAAEKLGADIDASAGWDLFRATLSVPVSRMAPALALLAEAVLRPTFPEMEVERLKQERLNRIMQAFADPTSRANRAFHQVVYSDDSPYQRDAAGKFSIVAKLSRDGVESFYRTYATPASATLLIVGDLEGFEATKTAEDLFGEWRTPEPNRKDLEVEEAITESSVTLVHRPGSVQSQLYAGHVGLPRNHPDFFPVSVMTTSLGGIFHSRLMLKLREEKGYTYVASARFDYRRKAGPFFASAAVETEVTKDAIADMLGEIRKVHDEGITEEELKLAKDYLVGVFPLRFETPDAIAVAISGLVLYGLPDDYYDTYRSKVEAVSLEDAGAAAADHLRPDRMAVVLTGDADAVGGRLRDAGLGAVTVVEDPLPGHPPE